MLPGMSTDIKTVNWFAPARARMAKTFQQDPHLKYGYVSTIACCLQDQYGMDHTTSNRAAEDIMRLVFEDK